MRHQSKKRRAENAERAAVREACFMRDQYRCQARGVLAGECSPGLECNEIIRRGQWRAGYLILDNTVTLCPRHHQWVTEHPAEAESFPQFYKRGHERPVAS